MEVIELDPLTEFFDAIRSHLTRDRYKHRLDMFLKHIGIDGKDLKARASSFVRLARNDESWATNQINSYMRYQKGRAQSGEISEATVPNFWKPIRLFCEQNDIILNWKKITKRIPSGRHVANDQSPTRSEIIQILG